jgi:hypothetical protein
MGIAPSLVSPSFETSVAGGNHELSWFSPPGTHTFTDTFDFDDLLLNFGARAIFAGPPGSSYRITNLELGTLSKLVLAPGDYYVENMTMLPMSQVVATGDGVVRLHLLNPPALHPSIDVNWDSQATDSNQDPSRLVIFAHDELVIPAGGRVAGYVYSQGDSHLDTGSRVAGSISGSSVRFAAGAQVTDLAASVPNSDFGDICLSQ